MKRVLLAVVALAPFVAGCAHHSKAAPLARATSTAVTPTEVEHEDAVAAAAQPCGTVFVHFALDSAVIQVSDEPALEGAVACLRKDHDAKIIVEGNTDERGTEEYNLALGERRATTVAHFMKNLGASGAQVHTVSFGENKPECVEHSEGCWAKNRRAVIGPERAGKVAQR